MIDVRSLFGPLDQKLLDLLRSLKPSDWSNQTVAKHWKVKDVVSHLLDGNLRVLSIQRDRYFGETPPALEGFDSMVDWLNGLNASWVNATKRLSPEVLILLHQTTGPLVCNYYESLKLNEPAIFSVDWAGESTSLNWMHLAREYTEKWHHQQQIRDAIGVEGIMTSEFFYPCMDTFFQALPFTFREVEAQAGTTLQATVLGEAGGQWFLSKEENGWVLLNELITTPDVLVEIPAEVSWKLFTKSVRPSEIMDQVKIEGDERLGKRVLEMVSVMA